MDHMDLLWAKIKSFEGEIFHTVSGIPFSYEILGNDLLRTGSEYPLNRSNFKKALDLRPKNVVAISRKVRGPSYVYAILTDPRIHALSKQ